MNRSGFKINWRWFAVSLVLVGSAASQDANNVPAGSDPRGRRPPLGPIRIEVECAFGVRDLLRHPDQIPRLWKRFETALVRTFPRDPLALGRLCQEARARRPPGERLVVSHAALLPPNPPLNARLADGFLLPSLRRLADRLGEPRISPPAFGVRTWLRERIAGSVREDAEVESAALELFRVGGYRLLSDEWEGAVHRGGARTLLLARAELAVDPETPLCVWLSLPATTRDAGEEIPAGAEASTMRSPSPDRRADRRHWEEFSTALDLLRLEYPRHRFDLWLWGTEPNGGSETIHVAWGGMISRGRVRFEADVARRFHPCLRGFEPPQGKEEK